MSIFGFKVCLASTMTSSVTHDGKPVAGAKVMRTVTFNDKEYITESETDAQGNFSLPALSDRTPWKHSPFEVVILSRVTITYEGESHLALRVSKRNFDEGGELNHLEKIKHGESTFIPYKFTCELTDPEFNRQLMTNRNSISGKCLYIGESKPTEASN